MIAAHDAADYIGTAIESALRQTVADLEVIVVDDGSSDGTSACVSQLRDPRVKLLQQPNQGQSVALNNGVQHARGAFIKLLDADDWINPGHLEAQLQAIGGRANVVSSCRWGYFVGQHERPTVRSENTDHDYDDPLQFIVDSLSLDEGMMGGWRWLIPRDLWDQTGGYDPRLSLNNDFHFSIKLLLASDGIRFADRAIYSYRKGIAGALSGSSGRSAMESAFLTTQLGTDLLLERENSSRIRKICADRFQQWLFRFYPEHPDLAAKADRRIAELGGSDVELQGGTLLRLLKPILGWKLVRRLQNVAYRSGWQSILRLKSARRLKQLE